MECIDKTFSQCNDEELLTWLGIDTRDRQLISEVTYYTCMKMLSETIGKMPIKYYQDTEQGRIRADPDEVTRLLTVRPNPIMTPTTLWTAVEMNCQHYGNGYVWIRGGLEKTEVMVAIIRSKICGSCRAVMLRF